MSFFAAYGLGALAIWAAVTVVWLVSLALRDASIVDVFWGLGFVLVAWVYWALSEGTTGREWILLALVTVWGVRLGGYILVRNWGHGEDYRYQRFRKNAGEAFWWRSYFTVFLLQGILMWVISAPLLAVQLPSRPAGLTFWDGLGVGVWLVGFVFEAGGDWQLQRFKADPENKGKLLTTGLWRYTRHPNYFGDAAQWWGFWLFAVAAPWGALTVVSPIVMTFLLLKVSGVALLEKGLSKSKPGYEDYVARTSAFIPWPPKSDAS